MQNGKRRNDKGRWGSEEMAERKTTAKKYLYTNRPGRLGTTNGIGMAGLGNIIFRHLHLFDQT